MSFEKLDSDELLRLSLASMNEGRDADAIVMLKTLLERDPRHAMARYLLAAQHAQIGLFDQAEIGFREAVAMAPEFPAARFQLGQLLLTKGANAEATEVMAPLAANDDAMGGYARALIAAGAEQGDVAIQELSTALAMPQDNAALADDMARLKARLESIAGGSPVSEFGAAPVGAPIFLTGYGQGGRAD